MVGKAQIAIKHNTQLHKCRRQRKGNSVQRQIILLSQNFDQKTNMCFVKREKEICSHPVFDIYSATLASQNGGNIKLSTICIMVETNAIVPDNVPKEKQYCARRELHR